MTRFSLSLAALIAIVALVAGSSTGSAATATSPRSATVESASSPFGRILVDTGGNTLYLFEKDKDARSACAGTCATYWPPLLVQGKLTARRGAKQSLLGTARRADGTRQATYAGHPLYRFLLDRKPGQANGEGLQDFGAGWHVVSPAGTRIEKDDR